MGGVRAHDIGLGLSAKLLILTLGFIMIAEVLFYIPSLGRAFETYSKRLFAEAERGIFAFNLLGDVSDEMEGLNTLLSQEAELALQGALIEDAGWARVKVRFDSGRIIASGMSREVQVARHIDMRTHVGMGGLIRHGLSLVFAGDKDHVIRFTTRLEQERALIDIWLPQAALIADLRGYSVRILLISITISIFSAALVYFCLRWLIVGPIEDLRLGLARFAKRPHDPLALIAEMDRTDEIGYIQAETRAMQLTISKTLQERERLATLGSAVAQINHDLRGMLSTALLLSDSLESSADPKVAQSAPILAQSIEKAVDLCASTLRFAKGDGGLIEDLALWNLALALSPLIEEWRLKWPELNITKQGDSKTMVRLDQLALHRALDNLARNAVEAGTKTLHVGWSQTKTEVEILLTDTGPGLPQKAQESLFIPFAGSTKAQGSGLGITNAADLMQAMGGHIELRRSNHCGTTFALFFPLTI